MGCLVLFFIFIQILKETSESKQWRTWSDAAFWSGFALFAYDPQDDARLIWIKVSETHLAH